MLPDALRHWGFPVLAPTDADGTAAATWAASAAMSAGGIGKLNLMVAFTAPGSAPALESWDVNPVTTLAIAAEHAAASFAPWEEEQLEASITAGCASILTTACA
jgi:hypothetical protein